MSNTWDAGRYQARHSYVFAYGEGLIDLLEPRPGERILDLGCGSGQLTAKIAGSGAETSGLDRSPEMIAEARRNFPELTFELGDAADFAVPTPVDAVFSNAVLHWVKDADGVARSVARALRPGGRFVLEMGGRGNTQAVMDALREVAGPVETPWYYPSVGEYAPILERHGLEVRNASLFDRPTPLDGENGLDQWLRMFGQTYLRQFSPERANQIVNQLVEQLRPALYRDGVWTVDYRRLRIVAVRTTSVRTT